MSSPGKFRSAELVSKMTLEGFDKRRREYKYLGWVYVAQNSCFDDKVFKIGQTQTSPSERMDTLSASTSVYKKFDLVYFVHVSEHLAAEKYVHQTLKDFRLNPGKEFFNAPLTTIIKTLDEAGNLWGLYRILRMSNFINVSEYTDTIGWIAFQPIAYHNISQIDTMPVRDLKKEGTDGSRSQVTIRFRIRGNKESYPFLNELAGANRYLWNAGLAHLKTQYEETGTSESSYFSLCTWYKDHKEEAEWLKGYPVALTRTGLKEVSNAFQQFFKKTKAYPRFKKKGRAKKSFAIDLDYRLSKNGYFRLKRGMRVKLMDWQRVNRYSNPQAKSGRIFEERGKWYMSIVFEVDAVEIITDGKGIGVDRNVGQVADSTGKIWYLTDTSHQVKRVKKLQKRLSRRTRGSQRYGKLLKTIGRHQHELANLRKNDLRHIAKGISIQSDLILLEDLKTKSMTASAKGTVENPGRNVKQKTGLNRVIRETGWGQLERYLSERGVVVKVNPAYTSQTCSKCGHVSKENRLTQSTFRCQSCTHQENADVNAALNIRTSGLASFNGRGAYIRPLFAETQVLKRQSESNHLRD